MQGKITKLDRTGHTVVEFDTEIPESREVAEEAIRRAKGEGYLATALVDGKRQQVSELDVGVASDYMLIPALQGG